MLVPATMELIGERNWWLPGWLDRLLPRIRVEGHEDLEQVRPGPEQDQDRVPVTTGQSR